MSVVDREPSKKMEVNAPAARARSFGARSCGRSAIALAFVSSCIALSVLGPGAPTASAEDIDPATGFPKTPGYETVLVQCTRCHSAKLVTQNRATREGWTEIIRWMQRTQKLGPLGEDEDVILDYLARHYAPEARSGVRRRQLPESMRPPRSDEPPKSFD